MPLISAIYAMVDVVANQVVINAGIFGTLKAIMTTILGGIPESRNYHLEAIFVRAPRISHIFQSYVIRLRINDSISTDIFSSLVAADAFL